MVRYGYYCPGGGKITLHVGKSVLGIGIVNVKLINIYVPELFLSILGLAGLEWVALSINIVG